MINSMTGYGKAVAELPGRKILVEIKSLNSKGLDLTVKVPGAFREKEMEIRNLVSQRLERGKIEVYISTEKSSETATYSINQAVVVQYYKEMQALAAVLGDDKDQELLPVIMNFPDVLQNDRSDFEQGDWDILYQSVESALVTAEEFRSSEGKILEDDMKARTGLITDMLESISPHEEGRISDLREKLNNGFLSLARSGQLPSTPDSNRFEQELIFYIERLDITEEKVRLKKHCDYFLETLAENGSQGKKLGFIAQEMGREINTIGSKANNAPIQKIVVQMKDELEKIKEQLLNIL